MKARNLYKRSERCYEGENELVLTEAMKEYGYRTNVWVTPNQMKGVGYQYGELMVKYGAKPIIIDKWDYRKQSSHKLALFNLDQTNFADVDPNQYQHFKNQDAELYWNNVRSKVVPKQHGLFSRIAAMF